jgi:hypothetical protein
VTEKERMKKKMKRQGSKIRIEEGQWAGKTQSV